MPNFMANLGYQMLTELEDFLAVVQQNLWFLLACLGGLWVIQLVNWLLRYQLNRLGILPRTKRGLIGIVFSPFLHGNFSHLMFNTLPLFVLANLVILEGRPKFYCVTITVILLSGSAIWLFARRGIHIGASSLVMGYWAYLLIHGFQHHSWLTIILALITFYYFGSLLINLFPQKIEVSWEGHVFGCMAGVAAVYWCPLVLIKLIG